MPCFSGMLESNEKKSIFSCRFEDFQDVGIGQHSNTHEEHAVYDMVVKKSVKTRSYWSSAMCF